MADMRNYKGKILDNRYEVHEIIGVGGMAVVYKAYDSLEGRDVAVKILKEEFLANEDYIRRFKNESKAIAMLSHPNIVTVYDVFYGQRLQYIVMDYIEGITLNEYIEQLGKLKPKEAIHYTVEILRALQHAHDKGVIHRDIKPQNIILLHSGSIKVADFGIAVSSRTETHEVGKNTVGSVHYFSPEQARGMHTDARSDIYSVGVVLYEMLTGRPPFQSDSSIAVATMQVNSQPKNPREIVPGIPVGLEQIILKAMRKDPEERYQSAAGMLLDIEECRRNPEVKFSYSYHVDQAPTKHVVRTEVDGGQKLGKTSRQEETPKRRMPLIVGFLAGLLALAVLVTGGLALFTDVFSTSKLTVPNFVGKDYLTEIKGVEEYSKFLIFADEVQNSQYESGIVFHQDPQRGAKISRDKQITLKIAVGTKMETIPNVYNHNFAEVQKTLEQLGFVVEGVAESDLTLDFGTVIRTSPEQGTQAPQRLLPRRVLRAGRRQRRRGLGGLAVHPAGRRPAELAAGRLRHRRP